MAETTELLYFDDTFRFECAAAVRSVEPHGDPVDGAPPRYAVVLDRTVAYPAGGGQPSDTGRLVNGDIVFSIDSVVAGKEDGVVRHVGAFEEGAAPFAVGDEVTVKVDQDARVLHARVHSAGHLLDVAMANVGYPSSILAPAKGMHAPDQAYVEYDGKVEGLDKESLIRALDDEMARLVKSGGKTASTLMPYEEASKACGGSLPPYIEPGSRPRVVVILPDTEGCPCGGTHVEDVGDVGAFAVTGVRVKKGVTRVSYTVEGMKGHK